MLRSAVPKAAPILRSSAPGGAAVLRSAPPGELSNSLRQEQVHAPVRQAAFRDLRATPYQGTSSSKTLYPQTPNPQAASLASWATAGAVGQQFSGSKLPAGNSTTCLAGAASREGQHGRGQVDIFNRSERPVAGTGPPLTAHGARSEHRPLVAASFLTPEYQAALVSQANTSALAPNLTPHRRPPDSNGIIPKQHRPLDVSFPDRSRHG